MAHPYELEVTKGRWSSAFFDRIGDETGDTCLCDVDGSVTPVDFKITAPSNRYFYIHQLTGALNCTKPLSRDGFAGGSMLTNGLILLEITKEGDERVMTNQLPIRRNSDFACYSPWTYTPQDNLLSWRFQITDDGTPFRLLPGHSMVWRVQDSLSAVMLGCRCMYMRAGMIRLPVMYR